MNLYEAERQARALLAIHGLTERGWRFEWDNAARRFGRCTYTTKTITMSRQLTVQRTPQAVGNTMLHEIAHALVGPGFGHGPVWRAKALELGCDGKRCSSDNVEVKYKYVAKCAAGHVAGKYLRRPRAIAQRSCGKCSRTYNPKYALKVYAI